METYKWYDSKEVLPEKLDLPKDNNGIIGFFLVALDNGDLACVNRWYDLEYGGWYWDVDNCFNNWLKDKRVSHWMKVENPIN